MTSNNFTLRFSGHDTFHCKEQWILKGLQLIENQGNKDAFKQIESISRLGVGKNMVRSIYHWLRAFGLLDDENIITEFANTLFIREQLDPYLEDEGSLWLLQYFICKSQYASIFNLIFSDYFSDKATYEFSESQILRFINKQLNIKNQKSIAEKTIESDFKVFVRSYVSPIKNHKTVEDDFNVPLISLNLVSDTGRKNDLGQSVYRINKENRDIPIEIFTYCLLNEFNDESSINFDEIRRTIGSYLCLTDDKLDDILRLLPSVFKQFVYKEDAGNREFGLKGIDFNFKNDLLKRYYEVQ